MELRTVASKALYAGYYIAEMLRLFTTNHDPHPPLYDWALDALGQIDGVGNPALALLGFDIAALRILGHAPSTRNCIDCGQRVARAPRMWFAPIGGGIVCQTCRVRQPTVIPTSPAVIEHLERLLAPHTRLPIQIPASVYREIRGLVSRYIQAILGTTPRMQPFLPARMEPVE